MRAFPQGRLRVAAALLVCVTPLVGATLLVCATSTPAAAQTSAAEDRLGPALTLPDAVRRALEVHPSVEAATAAVEAARAGVASARAERLPTVAADAFATRHQEPMLVAPIHGFDPAAAPDFDQTLIQASLALDLTLFDGGRRGALTREARARVGASNADLADTRAALIERTVQAYLALLTARDLVDAHASLETALEAERARVQRFLDEGSAPRLELLRAEAELARARGEAEAARRGAELAVATLARLLDEDTAAVAGWDLADPALAARPTLPDTDPAALGTAARADGSPRVARALDDLAAAEARVAAARSARLPRIGAQGGYTFFAGGATDAVGEWRAGVRLSYPLFTGGARGAAIDQATARSRSAAARVDAVRDEVALIADRARTAELEARARADALTAAVTSYEELTRVERLALDEGSGVQSDFLRSVAALQEARAGLAHTRRAVLEARVLEARALGSLTLDWIQRWTEVRP